jgi:hypothetical protein
MIITNKNIVEIKHSLVVLNVYLPVRLLKCSKTIVQNSWTQSDA